MKHKTVKILVTVLLVLVVATAILHLCPGVEAELHRITGWN
ncbi:MAG: hypothetical protein Q4G58_01475 [bacterium]|nr:hypothetical protein [bacterium]